MKLPPMDRLGARRAPRVLAGLVWLALALGIGWLWTSARGAEAPAPAASAEPPANANPHGSFQEDCGLCHGAEAWVPAQVRPRFDHAKSGFALTGAHAAANCLACHATLDFKQEKTRCASCHEDVHRGEMGSDCAHCHTARSFIDRTGMMRAHQLTRFPLTGSHAVLDCESCHQPAAQGHLQFVNTQAECQACHLADYQGTVNPDHAAGGFPLECASCHSTLAWATARFDHSRSSFPLTGRHTAVSCLECHGGGVWNGAPTNCAACHRDDYNATADPPHAASGFSLACATCHSTAGWDGASFDHDGRFFPIYSGAHRQAWQSCADCHNNAANYSQFTCVACHEHSDQAEVDGDHREVSNYRYDSQACYSCHPRGNH